MNWITATRNPCPKARSTLPKPAVVLPFPFPVMTRKTPFRVSRPSVGTADPSVAPSLASERLIQSGYQQIIQSVNPVGSTQVTPSYGASPDLVDSPCLSREVI